MNVYPKKYHQFVLKLKERLNENFYINRNAALLMETESPFSFSFSITIDGEKVIDIVLDDNEKRLEFSRVSNPNVLACASCCFHRIPPHAILDTEVKHYQINTHCWSLANNGRVNGLDNVIEEMLPLPDLVIVTKITNLFACNGFNISNANIEFDFVNKEYHFNYEDITHIILSDAKFVYKYTSLDTLFKILSSRKMRMNSAVAMNDKSEMVFIDDYVNNYLTDINRHVVHADSVLLSSFTNKEDDLTMWRLYGDDNKGVCMCFSVPGNLNTSFKFQPVQYIDCSQSNNDEVDTIKSLLANLKSDNIVARCKFNEHNKCFFKSSEYHTEEEYRLVNICDNPNYFMSNENLITPYKDFDLYYIDTPFSSAYPLELVSIMVSKNLPNFAVNYPLLVKLCRSLREDMIVEVKLSHIGSYR